MVEAMIDDARSLWELIERRAAATPDAPLGIDEDGRTLTFGEYRAASERAAAGLSELGVGEGTPVSWQLPTWFESIVLVGALSRLGAVQNPILPIYREREVGFVTKQTGAQLLIVPSQWKGFDYEAMARDDRRRPARPRRARRRPQAPRRRPRRAGARGVAARRPVRASRALGLLHVGHDGRPEGRQAHRSDDHGVRLRHGGRARAHRRRHRRAGVPVHAHRRDRIAVRNADERLRARS